MPNWDSCSIHFENTNLGKQLFNKTREALEKNSNNGKIVIRSDIEINDSKIYFSIRNLSLKNLDDILFKLSNEINNSIITTFITFDHSAHTELYIYEFENGLINLKTIEPNFMISNCLDKLKINEDDKNEIFEIAENVFKKLFVFNRNKCSLEYITKIPKNINNDFIVSTYTYFYNDYKVVASLSYHYNLVQFVVYKVIRKEMFDYEKL